MTLAIDKATAALPRNDDDEPYRALWSSVLYLAIRDCNRKGNARAALHWIYAPHDEVGSLRWICDMLDLDYQKLQNICMTREGRSKILKSNMRLNHAYRPPVASLD